MQDKETAISVKNLKKFYGRKIAVNGVHLNVKIGEVFSLLGPNGAGKTSIVEILEGHRKKTSGDVDVNKAIRLAAANNNCPDLLMLLRHSDADPNCADVNPEKRFTPLHLAVPRGHCHVVRILLQNGARLDSKDAAGKTPGDHVGAQDFWMQELLGEDTPGVPRAFASS